MRSFKKLIALIIVCTAMLFLASCGSKTGIVATMEYVATSTTVKITAKFDESENVKNSKIQIKEYTLDSDGNETWKETKDASFSSEIYTKTTVEFTGLTKDTKYLYKLYATLSGVSEELTTLEVTTLSDSVIEIKSEADFNLIGDNPSGDFVLTSDLDFTNVTLENNITSSKKFTGTFDGNNHKISNVTLTTSYTALFPYVKEATIKNLTIENVSADYSTGRSNADIGALAGNVESSTISDIKVSNVSYKVKGNTTAIINCGGIVGSAVTSSFKNCSVTNADIEFTYSRYKTNVGLFAGQLGDNNPSVDKVTYEGTEVKYLAGSCYGSGKITVAMSTTTNTDGFTHIGGFAGDISSPSIVYDSYSDCEILLTKNYSMSGEIVNADQIKANIAVGGFVGCNNIGSLKIKKSLANASISVFAGNKDYPTQADNELMTKSDKDKKYYSYIGGFVGVSYPIIATISDCIYKAKDSGITIHALDTQTIDSADVQVLFKGNTIAENRDSDTKIVNLVEWNSSLSTDSYGDTVKGFLNK